MQQPATVKKALWISRLSLSALNFNFGFTIACWLGSIPSFRLAFNLNTAQLGFVIFCSGIASICMTKPGAYLVGKYGPRKVVWVSGTLSSLYSSRLPYISKHIGNFPVYPLVLLSGLFSTGYGIAFSTKAVEMEHLWQRPIMSSFHAFWSIGAFSGSLFYSTLLGPAGMDWFTAFPLVCLLNIIITSFAAYFLDADIQCSELQVPDLPTSDFSPILSQVLLSPTYADSITPIRSKRSVVSPGGSLILSPEGTPLNVKPPKSHQVEWKVYLFGALGGLALLTEGSVGDWSGLFILQYDAGAKMSMVPLTYASYAGLMTLSRLVGDSLAYKFGRKTVCELGSSLAFLGFVIFIELDYLPISLLSCGLIGLGLANNLPVLQSSLGQLESSKDPQQRPLNLALFSVLCQLGLLSGPAVLAPVAHHFGLKYAFIIPLVAVTLIGLIAPGLIDTSAASS